MNGIMDPWTMSLDDLAVWFINYVKRLKLAGELKCGGERHANWTCCIVHQGLDNESLHMRRVARRLHQNNEDCAIFSENWWNVVGQPDAAEAARL